MAPSSDYTARHLSVLEGLEAVRKRPGMYIGSTDSRGLMHCLWEIIDNSVDEALAGFGHDIKIILHADNSVEIHDDGRGVPVDIEPKTGLSGVEVVFTKLHAGGKFGGGSYTASGGLHGVGASVVNALSARLDVEVDRGGKTYKMSFRRGEPGRFKDTGTKPDPASVFEPFVDGSVLDVDRQGQARRHRNPDPLLGGPPDLHPGRQVLLRRARLPGPPDLLPGPRAEAHRPGRTQGCRHAGRVRAARGSLPPRRRHLRVRRLPRRRPRRHGHLAPARRREVQGDRAGH